jgi:hypothetical protein
MIFAKNFRSKFENIEVSHTCLPISQLYPFKQNLDNIQVGLRLLISPSGKASTWAVSDKWPFLPSSQNRRGGVERGGIRYRKKTLKS